MDNSDGKQPDSILMVAVAFAIASLWKRWDWRLTVLMLVGLLAVTALLLIFS